MDMGLRVVTSRKAPTPCSKMGLVPGRWPPLAKTYDLGPLESSQIKALSELVISKTKTSSKPSRMQRGFAVQELEVAQFSRVHGAPFKNLVPLRKCIHKHSFGAPNSTQRAPDGRSAQSKPWNRRQTPRAKPPVGEIIHRFPRLLQARRLEARSAKFVIRWMVARCRSRHLEAMVETIVWWYLQGNHHSRGS